MKLAVALALAAAALTAGSAAADTNECRGLNPCVAVAGPWVVVPAGSAVPRAKAQFQLACPRGWGVGGTDAELSDGAIDLSFLGASGAPVSPGVTTSRTIVFVASYAGTAKGAPTFRPHIGCVPMTGGGRRTPTGVVPPGAADRPSRRHQPRCRDEADRRLLPRRRAARRLVRDARLRDARAAGGPARREPDCHSARERCVGRRGRPREPRPGDRPGRGSLRGWPMSFGHPLLLLTLLALPLLAAAYLWLQRRPPRYAMAYTNVDLLVAVSRGQTWRRYVPPALRAARRSRRCAWRWPARSARRSWRRRTRRSSSSSTCPGR